MKSSLPHLNQQTLRHPGSCPISAPRDTLEPRCQPRYAPSAFMSGLISLLANAATHNKHGLCISVAVTGLYFFFLWGILGKKKKKKQKRKKTTPKTSCWGRRSPATKRSSALRYRVRDEGLPSGPFPHPRAGRLMPLAGDKAGTV